MPFFSIDALSFQYSVVLFALCALVIAVTGTRISAIVDALADRTGLGEAVAGAICLGAATSLSGAVLSVTAAANGQAELAISNAIGGIAVQTAFLAVADITYRRANLEHAAASIANLAQCGLLLGMLSILLVGRYAPAFTLWSVHPVTPLLILAYGAGVVLIRSIEALPMWTPAMTRETRRDTPDSDSEEPSLLSLWWQFAMLAGTLATMGWVAEGAASNIASATGLNQTVVGVLLTAVATSLPELVTTIAAVQRGALQLAVGGIIGGNAYDCLFVAASDVAYRDGSIYHAIPDRSLLWIALSMTMATVLLLGLIRRQREGLGGIGFESVMVLLLYIAGIGMVLST